MFLITDFQGFIIMLAKKSPTIQRLKDFSLALVCSLSLSACSVGMAINGQKEPDLNVVKRGVHRSDIEVHFGAPMSIQTHRNGSITAVYEYEVGKESSPGRAVAHGVMDVLILGIWEVVGTPVEACKGDHFHLTVTYDKDGNVISAQKTECS